MEIEMDIESIKYYGTPKSMVPQYISYCIYRELLTDDEIEIYERHRPVITRMASQTFISGQFKNIDDHDFILMVNVVFNKETEDHGSKIETVNNLIKKFLQSEFFITDKADPRKDVAITEGVAKNLPFHKLLEFLKIENYLDEDENKYVTDVMKIFIIEHGKRAGWII